jgi:hypothetical protein
MNFPACDLAHAELLTYSSHPSPACRGWIGAQLRLYLEAPNHRSREWREPSASKVSCASDSPFFTIRSPIKRKHIRTRLREPMLGTIPRPPKHENEGTGTSKVIRGGFLARQSYIPSRVFVGHK